MTIKLVKFIHKQKRIFNNKILIEYFFQKKKQLLFTHLLI